MQGFFDYAVCIVGLTGTLLGGYADDLYNLLLRLQPQRMVGNGYEWGTSGRSAFAQDYAVLETITKIEPEENACSDGKTTVTVKRKPGAYRGRCQRWDPLPQVFRVV